MATPVLARSLASRAVTAYVRYSPIERGKYRLLMECAGWLDVEITDGVRVRIEHPEDNMERSIVRGWKEQRESEVFLSMLNPGDTVFDLGANLGLYAMLASRRVGPHGCVHAFEPNPRVAEKLRGNVAHNWMGNVECCQMALSDRRGTLPFYLAESDDQCSLGAVSDKSIAVPVMTLDEYVADQRIGRVDAMKIDVEGAETAVLRGGRELLSRPDAPVLYIEVNPSALERFGSSADELESVMRAYGYSLRTVADHGGYRNVLAVKG